MTKLKLVYDIKSTPQGLDVATFTKIWEQHHVVFWDSDKGVKPRIYGDDTEVLPKIVDTSGEEIDFEKYAAEFAEEEFWKKELHNCKSSPIYFWNNYGTSCWPPKNEELQAYLTEVGLGEITETDSEKAQEAWEAQKKKLKAAGERYTIEMLKERKASVDILKSQYEQEVMELENILAPHVRLKDSNNVPLKEVKQVANLTLKIKKFLPVHKKYSEKYRTRKDKWDVPMLHATPYKTLLRMYYDILKDSNRLESPMDSGSSDS